MMHEITSVKQDTPELVRRWYQDEYLDFFVWLTRRGQVRAFQLAYDRGHRERMLEWSSAGFSHTAVDAGEATPVKNMSPLLVAAPAATLRPVWREFALRSGELDEPTRRFVLSKLRHASRVRRLISRCAPAREGHHAH